MRTKDNGSSASSDSLRGGLPLRDAGVPCGNCGCEKRRPNTNRCAACGQFADDPRYGRSPITGTWYRLHDYEDLGDGKVVAKGKTEVSREDVPQHWIDATEERDLDD